MRTLVCSQILRPGKLRAADGTDEAFLVEMCCGVVRRQLSHAAELHVALGAGSRRLSGLAVVRRSVTFVRRLGAERLVTDRTERGRVFAMHVAVRDNLVSAVERAIACAAAVNPLLRWLSLATSCGSLLL